MSERETPEFLSGKVSSACIATLNHNSTGSLSHLLQKLHNEDIFTCYSN